jgi:hypothetical protein
MSTSEERAYALWETRGRPMGDDWTDWFAAEALHSQRGAERAGTAGQPRPEAKRLQRLDETIVIAVQESARLLDALYVDDGDYRHFAQPYDLGGAKRYLLSRCLMNVQVAAGAMLRLRSYMEVASLREAASEGLAETIARSIVAEQALWRRRLTEVLASVVLFATTDADAHYLSYLLLQEAVEAKRETESLRRDFSIESATLRRRSESLQDELRRLNVAISVWYAEPDRGGTLRVPTAAKIIRAALDAAAPHERTALGYSYRDGFSSASATIHFSSHVPRQAHADDDIEFGIVALLLLSNAVTTRVAALAGLPSALALERGQRVADARLPQVGDFVVVILDRTSPFLGEVVEKREAGGVVGCVRVRFLGEPPYADIQEDDFPSDIVHLFLGRAGLLNDVSRLLPVEALPIEVDEALRHGAKMMWTSVGRDRYLEGLRDARRSLSG